MLSTLLAIGAVLLIGAACIWASNNWIKSFVYILLMLSVIFFGLSNIGIPRPYWLLGVPNGYLVSNFTNANHTKIYLWIRPKDDTKPTSFQLPYSEAVQKMLNEAKKKAGPKGSVIIHGTGSLLSRLEGMLKGLLHLPHGTTGQPREGNRGPASSPFAHVPFEAYPQPWTNGPPKLLPRTYSGN